MIPNKEKNANLNFYIFRPIIRNPRNGLPPNGFRIFHQLIRNPRNGLPANDFRIFQQIIRKQQKWKFEFLQQN